MQTLAPYIAQWATPIYSPNRGDLPAEEPSQINLIKQVSNKAFFSNGEASRVMPTLAIKLKSIEGEIFRLRVKQTHVDKHSKKRLTDHQ